MLPMSACGIAAPPVVVKSREAGTAVAPTTTELCPATRPTWVAVDPAEQAVSVIPAKTVISAAARRRVMSAEVSSPGDGGRADTPGQPEIIDSAEGEFRVELMVKLALECR